MSIAVDDVDHDSYPLNIYRLCVRLHTDSMPLHPEEDDVLQHASSAESGCGFQNCIDQSSMREAGTGDCFNQICQGTELK